MNAIRSFIRSNGGKMVAVSFTALTISCIAFVLASSIYIGSEPTIVSATATSSTVVVTLNVTSGVSIASNAYVAAMSQSLGVSANTAIATSTFTVATNSTTGYSLTVQATSTPAMKSITATDTIPDMSSTPGAWSVSSGAAQFGFSVFGTDVNTGTFGTGGTCGSANTPGAGSSLLYRGFVGATPITVAARGSTTTPSGVVTTVCYGVGQNNYYIASGNYNATVTATATAT